VTLAVSPGGETKLRGASVCDNGIQTQAATPFGAAFRTGRSYLVAMALSAAGRDPNQKHTGVLLLQTPAYPVEADLLLAGIGLGSRRIRFLCDRISSSGPSDVSCFTANRCRLCRVSRWSSFFLGSASTRAASTPSFSPCLPLALLLNTLISRWASTWFKVHTCAAPLGPSDLIQTTCQNFDCSKDHWRGDDHRAVDHNMVLCQRGTGVRITLT